MRTLVRLLFGIIMLRWQLGVDMDTSYFAKLVRRVAILAGTASLATGCCTPDVIPDPPRCAAVGAPNSTLIAPASCEFHIQTDQVCTYDEYGRIKTFTLAQDHQCSCGHL